jgi:superfamily II DNA/RNA helicase
MDDILSAGGSQCVYFAWHKRPVYELARRCEEAGIPCTVICGDVSQAERERRIDLFKRGGYRVLVATIATLSSAANLQCASVVGLLEESDDPVDNEQAIGRVVRQGQPVHASVYHYRVPDSVDTLSVQTNAASKAELRRLLLGTT